jgi:hypothetical protein
LILRHKPRNRRGDFDAQITKPKLPVLSLKPGNHPPPYFWVSTKKLTTDFEAKLGETIATSFEVKLEKNVATGFEVKPVKTVWVILRSNHSQTVAIGFEAQTDEKPSEWFWGQTTHKPSTLVLRLNQETHAPHLHVHGVDRTRRHPTFDRPATEYPTCAIIPGPLHQVSYSCHDPRQCTPCRTCHQHTTRQANVIPRQNNIKVKPMNRPRFEFKPYQANDSSQSNQRIDHLVSQSPPWWIHWQQKHKVWSSNPRPHEAHVEDQKRKKKLKKVI